ncbi:MAG: hypothetical protein EU529_06970 [Promethearchaeota archaeon]|nr:MAG: hypothetical protein EU540_03085 [Candidatus Lokiarchaeota archaeon]TFG23590.1 MAG: hypothetical protein EU529_06970 [Candidatus Lokiarchaeota archaeon]
MITEKDLKRELDKRGWGKHLGFAISEYNKGKSYEEVYQAVANKDSEAFIENLENPKEMFLPRKYLHNEAEIELGGEEKKEGYLRVSGNAKIKVQCHVGQKPFKEGNILGCIDDPEENLE